MKKLSSLLSDLGEYKALGDTNLKITSIEDDSRKVKKGSLFVAIKGLTVDGHKYIPNAIKSGAVAVVGEIDHNFPDTTFIKVKNSRQALGFLASAWFGNPSKKLKLIGVTGTDGKTTTANIIYWFLSKAGRKAGLISTIGAKIGDKTYNTGFHVTNPEPMALHQFLAKMVQKKCEFAVIEVTSHGLDQERDSGLDFNLGVLTNITHEHLDYHKTFKNYVKAKAKLFINSKVAVLNKDDQSIKVLKKYIPKDRKVLYYGKELLKGALEKTITERFTQGYNKLNTLAALTAVNFFEVMESQVLDAIKTIPPLKGRLEQIKNDNGITLFVDFAHTPNALRSVLVSLKKNLQKTNRLIVVFGCAGERDVKKRILMPKQSVRLADFSVFTAEDPRSEHVEDILSMMSKAASEEGAKENQDYYCIPNRGEAVYFAINKLARKGDIVVVCGKGHEKSMAYQGIEYDWSDQEAVRLSLSGKIKKVKYIR